MLQLPKDILDYIISLHNARQNTLLISKLVEQKYGEVLKDKGLPIPSYSQLDKYLKSIQSNNPSSFTENSKPNTTTLIETDTNGTHKLSSYDTLLGKQIHLNSVKDTNTDIKTRIAATIVRMENQRVNYPETFTDKDEDRLQRYYDILSKHNLSELKVAEALKDKDVLDTQSVVFFINKLFSSIKLCVDKYASNNKDRFFLDLKNLLLNTNESSVGIILSKIEQFK